MEVYSWKIIKRNGDYHRVTSKNGDDVEYLMAIFDGIDSKRYDKLDNDEKSVEFGKKMETLLGTMKINH